MNTTADSNNGLKKDGFSVPRTIAPKKPKSNASTCPYCHGTGSAVVPQKKTSPNASSLKAPKLRSPGTFDRSKIEFKAAEQLVVKNKPSKSPVSVGIATLTYADRADRKIRILLVVAGVVLVMMTVIFKLRPNYKASPSRVGSSSSSLQMKMESVWNSADVEKPRLEQELRVVSKAQQTGASKSESIESDNDGLDLNVSVQDPKVVMEGKISNSQAKNSQFNPVVAAPSKEVATSPVVLSGWSEPQKIDGVALPSRLYDEMAPPEVRVETEAQPAPRKLQ